MYLLICVGLWLGCFSEAIEFTPKGCGANYEYGFHDTHYSFKSTKSDSSNCRLSTDLAIPWMVHYTITIQMQAIGGTTPGVMFNEHDDSNYDFVFFRPADYNCLRPGRVKGNSFKEYLTHDTYCDGNTINIGEWFDVMINVTSSWFSVSVNHWPSLQYPTSQPLAPTIGLIHGTGYEYLCNYECELNAKTISILPDPSTFYAYTGPEHTLQLPEYIKSMAIPQDNISVMRIHFDRLGQPADSYCIVAFYFNDLDIGTAVVSISGITTHNAKAFEKYTTNSPYLDVFFNPMTIEANLRGFSIAYDVLKCGTNATDLDLLFLCTDGNHINLYENYHRSTAYNFSTDHTDSILAMDWYRFSSCAGDTIPTTSPGEEGVCGTQYPIWMADENQGRVCLYRNVTDCYDEWEVPVLNCPRFKLYYLIPTPTGSAYCAGNKRQCNASLDEVSVDGSGCEVCTQGKFPKMSQNPNIDQWIQGNDEYKLPCNVYGPTDTTEDVLYQIQWLVDFGTHRYVIKEGPDFVENTIFYLELSLLENDHLQKNVICRAKSKYIHYADSSDWSTSDPFFIGMSASTFTQSISYDEDLDLSVTFTIPISAVSDNNCHINIVFATTTQGLQRQTACQNLIYLQPELVHLDPCVHRVQCSDWNKVITHTVKVKNTVQDLPYPSHTYTLYVVSKGDASTIWNTVVVEVQVPVDTSSSADHDLDSKCFSHNDPHIQTFQGTKYDVHGTGEHVLYKSTPKNDKDMHVLVTVEYEICSLNNAIACNKAVGIRVKDEAIIIDTRIIPKHRYIGPGYGEKKFSATVSKDMLHYKVKLPRGEIVVVDLQGEYLNVDVWSLREQQATTSGNGLCGKITPSTTSGDHREMTLPNGQPNYLNTKISTWQDLPEFGLAWKATDEDALIEKDSLAQLNTNLQDDMYSCQLENVHEIKEAPASSNKFSSASLDIDRCIPVSDDVTHLMRELRKHGLNMGRKRRHTAQRSSNNHPNSRAERSTHQNTWTDQTAYDHCKKHIADTPTGQACDQVTPKSVVTAVEQCAIDIVLTNSTEWLEGTLDSLREACKISLYQQLNLWTFDQNSTDFQPPAALADNLCPNDCNSHGQCVGGQCDCNSGYIGTDCSLSVDKPPTIDEIIDGSICHPNETCVEMVLAGAGFVQSGDLTCHFSIADQTSATIVDGSILVTPKTAGFLISYGAISCTWPVVKNEGGYTNLSVAVSNDGVHKSDLLYGIAAVHASCVTCIVVGDRVNCSVQENWCLIDYKCISATNISLHDECLYCDPTVVNYDWTSNTGLGCYSKTLEPWHMALIAIGCVVMLATIVVLTLLLVKKCSTNSKIVSNGTKYESGDG